MITAEYYGGPNDGKEEELDKYSYIIYVPELMHLSTGDLRENTPLTPENTKIMVNIYRAVAHGRYGDIEIVRYQWEGIQK